MLVIAALGGNALLRRGERADVTTQRRNVAAAVDSLAAIAAEHDLVVTHGNGPQVGLLALQSAAYREVPAYPLDVLGAESEGMVGYLLEQGFGNRLPDRDVATLLTQVVVAADDPAFATPTKPIGPVYGEQEAHALARERGWAVGPDGASWRRLVGSPQPQRIVELPAIRILLAAGVLVVCGGGGGIPVVIDPSGGVHGVEAVIDKDRSAALLARELHADALLLLTDVPAVQQDWGTAAARPLRCVRAEHVGALGLDGGSMGPKVEAAARFATETGGIAAIGALTEAPAILAGTAGTRVLAAREAHERAAAPGWTGRGGPP